MWFSRHIKHQKQIQSSSCVMPCATHYLSGIFLPKQPSSTHTSLMLWSHEGLMRDIIWLTRCMLGKPSTEYHHTAATARDLGQLGIAGHRQSVILRLWLALCMFVQAALAFLTLMNITWCDGPSARNPSQNNGLSLDQFHTCSSMCLGALLLWPPKSSMVFQHQL